MITKDRKESSLKEGMIVSGNVQSIEPYGAFIKTKDGKYGLLHIEDISVSRIKSPYERFEIGQKLDVMVKSVDSATNKIAFSSKELYGTWEENAKKFEEKTIVTGIAKDADKLKNGIFVELTSNLVGMADYEDDIEYGQEVKVYIRKIIPDKKKIKLSFIKEEE